MILKWKVGNKMKKINGILKGLFLIVGIFIHIPANASIINTIEGQSYEWLELSGTAGFSRIEVEDLLADTLSSFYGYRYATRTETQALLESYSPNPEELNHWYSYMAPGAQEFFDDFGVLYNDDFDGDYTTTSTTIYNQLTADGVQISYNLGINSYFFYGASDECGLDVSCVGRMYGLALDGVMQAQLTPAVRGFDATIANPYTLPVDSSEFIRASLLVREITAVPVPAAVWLFSSGIIALFAAARSRKTIAS